MLQQRIAESGPLFVFMQGGFVLYFWFWSFCFIPDNGGAYPEDRAESAGIVFCKLSLSNGAGVREGWTLESGSA